MDDIEILLALLAVAAGAVWLARALEIPYPFLLVLAGVGVGYLPGVSEIEVEPDVIFLVFLPPLLHAAGWLSSPRHLRTYATGVTLLAGVLVLLTTGAVAVVAHAVIPGLSWGAAFVLGAIVSATDTVAATAVFRRLGVPERVVALVEGESLVNDGTALVALPHRRAGRGGGRVLARRRRARPPARRHRRRRVRPRGRLARAAAAPRASTTT